MLFINECLARNDASLTHSSRTKSHFYFLFGYIRMNLVSSGTMRIYKISTQNQLTLIQNVHIYALHDNMASLVKESAKQLAKRGTK